MKLVGISGTIIGAKTEIVVSSVLEQVKKHYPEIETELLDLKNFDVQFCDGRDPSQYTGDTRAAMDMIESGDFFLIGTPIYQASMSGVLKNLFDLIPVTALQQKVVGFVATGGTYQHYLVIENQLKPIAGFFRSFVAPSYVYAHDDHFNEFKELTDPDVLARIEKLAHELVFMQQRLKSVE
ncbi:NADPH-dependent FMN reductase [Paenibacillus sp. FJAT-26967]|uniref:NADPH-dependent FMN reductase n=1 Tax=Paenibacillus sp. FJAT-26967 TaxID=1729690 RepID=UPI0008391D22|nr:NADPH-dependent FMN reductase [Paenibacillus sp. FJAT-26967]